MPTYQYACTACGERLEAVQSFTDAPLTECRECRGALRKVFSAVGVVFKGSGFYKNDSRDSGQKGASSKDGAKEGGTDSGKEASKEGASAGAAAKESSGAKKLASSSSGPGGGSDAGSGGAGSGKGSGAQPSKTAPAKTTTPASSNT